jgi:hypothetical protein
MSVEMVLTLCQSMALAADGEDIFSISVESLSNISSDRTSAPAGEAPGIGVIPSSLSSMNSASHVLLAI